MQLLCYVQVSRRELSIASMPRKGPHTTTEAESDSRYSALRKSGAASGQWVVIGICPILIS